MVTTNIMAQTTNENETKTTVTDNSTAICENPDTPVHYEGGENGLDRYIKTSIQYPYQAKREAVEGTVVVSYIMNEEGLADEVEAVSYNGIKAAKGKSIQMVALEKYMDKYPKTKAKAQRQYTEAVQSLLVEAVRVVFNIPEATPAKKNGKAVRVKCTIPVEFVYTEKHI